MKNIQTHNIINHEVAGKRKKTHALRGCFSFHIQTWLGRNDVLPLADERRRLLKRAIFSTPMHSITVKQKNSKRPVFFGHGSKKYDTFVVFVGGRGGGSVLFCSFCTIVKILLFIV